MGSNVYQALGAGAFGADQSTRVAAAPRSKTAHETSRATRGPAVNQGSGAAPATDGALNAEIRGLFERAAKVSGATFCVCACAYFLCAVKRTHT